MKCYFMPKEIYHLKWSTSYHLKGDHCTSWFDLLCQLVINSIRLLTVMVLEWFPLFCFDRTLLSRCQALHFLVRQTGIRKFFMAGGLLTCTCWPLCLASGSAESMASLHAGSIIQCLFEKNCGISCRKMKHGNSILIHCIDFFIWYASISTDPISFINTWRKLGIYEKKKKAS